MIQVVSSGPFNLAGGDSITVAFALIAGDSLADIQQSAANAQIKYDGILTSVQENIAHGSETQLLNPYPNPNSGNELNIPFYIAKNQINSVNISLTDMTGRTVVDLQNIQTISGMNIQTVNMAGLSNGIYLIKLESAGKIYTGKISVQH